MEQKHESDLTRKEKTRAGNPEDQITQKQEKVRISVDLLSFRFVNRNYRYIYDQHADSGPFKMHKRTRFLPSLLWTPIMKLTPLL